MLCIKLIHLKLTKVQVRPTLPLIHGIIKDKENITHKALIQMLSKNIWKTKECVNYQPTDFTTYYPIWSYKIFKSYKVC